MNKLKLLVCLGALVVPTVSGTTIVGAGTAFAAPAHGYTCSGGAIPAGTYNGLTVTGTCSFTGDHITVNGALTVAPGAILNDHAASRTTVRVNGNVRVGQGAVLGLGRYGPPGTTSPTVVNGNIRADRPLSLYLGGITVKGSVTSIGGVAPTPGPASAFRNFPFKDDTVNGNLTIEGWQGGWLGVIRAHVGGDVTVSGNSSVIVPTGCDEETGECTGSAPGTDPDSTEVQTNVIGGDLDCEGNTPPAQVNADDGGQPNTVAGLKLGECADL